MRLIFKGLAIAACLGWAGAAAAQNARFVPAAEFYFEEDTRTARPIMAEAGSGDAVVERLTKAIARNPRAREATAQLAHLAMAGGRPELGHELYRRLQAQTVVNDGLYRPLLWNYGWDLYRAGDYAGALGQWETLVKSRSLTAAWMPPTLALVLWQLDRREEAVLWYAAAVRTDPDRWGTVAFFSTLLPDWHEQDLATLGDVQAAWATELPAWN